MEKKSSKKKKWMKLRHRVVRNIAYMILYPFSRLKYGIKVDKFKEQGKRNYLILSNHQTAFDQFFLGMAFKGPIYYMASEDLFSKGLVSLLIKTLVAPIPIKNRQLTFKLFSIARELPVRVVLLLFSPRVIAPSAERQSQSRRLSLRLLSH
ncbi:MAG: 1-acyl-sn-glycerol-3-phosphate acyltransferase [Clostridia bacterium]|nr:1-acyl-sn-glycerol-3-phosphate acyltransferase [Clostridia bacterium]